jgi:hypothetical protein
VFLLDVLLHEDYTSDKNDESMTKDKNSIIFAPECKSNDYNPCFTSSNVKKCKHKEMTVPLDHVENYVKFPARVYHHGYYNIRSNMTYYMVQLFCTPPLHNVHVWQNVMRRVNTEIESGDMDDFSMRELTDDLQDNWDSTYGLAKFPPSREFGGDKIDARKNRHIKRALIIDGKLQRIANLVAYFEKKFSHVELSSAWLIEKSSQDDGFQGWHREFFLGTNITTTIVVNVGAITKN